MPRKNLVFSLSGLFVLLVFNSTNCGYVPARDAAGGGTDTIAAMDSVVNDTIILPEDSIIYRAAMVDEVTILLLESFPVQVQAVVKGYFPDGCTRIGDISRRREGNTFIVKIGTQRPRDAVCTQALVPFEEVVRLDAEGLKAGEYAVDVNGVRAGFTLAQDNRLK